MANLGSSNTPISGESFDLPSGWSFEENVDGEVIITDSGGTTIGRRDETNGKWVFDSIVSDTLEASKKINTADITSAAEDEVLKKAASGSDFKFGTVNTESNVPDWTEDANSPFSPSSGTFSISLDGEYDFIRLFCYLDHDDDNGFSNSVTLSKINGSTPSADYYGLGGSEITGKSDPELGNLAAVSQVYGVFDISGRGDEIVVQNCPVVMTSNDAGIVDGNAHTGISGPVNSLTVDIGINLSGTIEVIGRSL